MIKTVWVLTVVTSDQYGKSETVGIFSSKLLAMRARNLFEGKQTGIQEVVLDEFKRPQ